VRWSPNSPCLKLRTVKPAWPYLTQQETAAVDLGITDFVMPSVSGLEVIAVLTCHRPDVAIIGMTGHTHPALLEGAASFGVRVVQKPFEIGPLLASAREVLAESRDGRGVQGCSQGRAEGVRPRQAVGLVDAAKALAKRGAFSEARS
jgi:DNA-binding NtrC family response regulator